MRTLLFIVHNISARLGVFEKTYEVYF